MENETPERNILGLVRDTSKRIATAVSNTTVAVADNTRSEFHLNPNQDF